MAAVTSDLSFVRTGFFAKSAAVFLSCGRHAFAGRVSAFLSFGGHRRLLLGPTSGREIMALALQAAPVL
jgi:hypothetical protein